MTQVSDTPQKIAVVCLALGGPTGAKTIKPFLQNFFMDPNIIRLPKPMRFALSRFIAWSRNRKEAGEAYGEMGGASPILENTKAQAAALLEELKLAQPDVDWRVHVCMRYWHPRAESVAAQVQAFKPDRVILLPLYPQFSTTTTRSALQDWASACKAIGFEVDTKVLCCHPWAKGYVQASAARLKPRYEEFVKQAKENGTKPPRILFSAHGLPESVIDDGDPYQWQCEQSAKAIVDAMGTKDLDWTICYQSKVGPMKWIGPSTEDEIERAAKENTPLLVYPHAFVCEHVETIVEIGVEYKEVAEHKGVPEFSGVETVGTLPSYIHDLAGHVQRLTGETADTIYKNHTDAGTCLCPEGFKRCCQRENPLAMV